MKSRKDLLAAVYAKAAALGVHLPSEETAIRWSLARAAGIGLVQADPAPAGVCEGCRAEREHLGRFVDDSGKEWAALCGGCKIRLTMTPARRRDLARLAKTLLEAPMGSVVDTVGESVEPPALLAVNEEKKQ
jgi:hypothetical protein